MKILNSVQLFIHQTQAYLIYFIALVFFLEIRSRFGWFHHVTTDAELIADGISALLWSLCLLTTKPVPEPAKEPPPAAARVRCRDNNTVVPFPGYIRKEELN